jgi:hypothetical protein
MVGKIWLKKMVKKQEYCGKEIMGRWRRMDIFV